MAKTVANMQRMPTRASKPPASCPTTRSVAIQKLPAIRVDTHFQQAKRRGPSVVAQQFDELERGQHHRVAVWLEGPHLGGYLPEAGKERR